MTFVMLHSAPLSLGGLLGFRLHHVFSDAGCKKHQCPDLNWVATQRNTLRGKFVGFRTARRPPTSLRSGSPLLSTFLSAFNLAVIGSLVESLMSTYFVFLGSS